MRRNTLNFLVDSATLLVALVMVITGLLLRFILVPGTGERCSLWGLGRHDWGDVHFWLAVAVAGLALFHLALHWSWVCVTVIGWMRPAGAAGNTTSRLRRILVGIALGAAIVAGVGVFLLVARGQVVERSGGEQHRGGRAAALERLDRGSAQP